MGGPHACTPARLYARTPEPPSYRGMQRLSWPSVTAWRLARQHLVRPAPRQRWLDVVSGIGGLHAQLMSAAELALAARVDALDPDHVARALWKDRSLVKTWMMRGTLHLVAARDLPRLVATLSTLKHFRKPHWLKYFKVTEPELDAILDATRAVLSDVGITREALADAIATRTRKPRFRASLSSGWGTLLKPAAFRGDLCFGPNDGQKVTFVKPAAWIGSWRALESEQALVETVRRYLATYGPAGPDEFARWLGIDPATAKRLFRALGDEIVPVAIDGFQAIALGATVAETEAAEPPRGARLLPFFDSYTIAVARQSRFLFPDKYRTRVYRSQGWIAPIVLLDGKIVAVWDQERKGSRVHLTVEPFGKAPPGLESAVEAEAARLTPFWKAPVTIQLGKRR